MAEPADLAGEFLKGVSTASQIRAEQNRLQQEQQQQAARLQQASQEESQRLAQVKQEHDLQQQRIQVSAAYNQQKAALRKQQLDQVEAVNNQKTKAAARQFQARQMWQQEFGRIDADTTLTDEQKDAAKSRAAMRLAPVMGTPGNELAATLRDLRPPKPTVPASVQDKGEFWQVTEPTGAVQIHPKPRSGADKDPNVKVVLDDSGSLVSMPKSQAMQVIPSLPPELQTNAVNKAVISGKTADSSSRQAVGKYKIGAVYKGGLKYLGGDPSDEANWEKTK